MMNEMLIKAIEEKVDAKSWRKWFSSFDVLEISEGRVVFSVSNLFIKDWLEEKYGKVIKKAVKEVLGEGFEYEIVYKESVSTDIVPVAEPSPKIIRVPGFNPDYTFENFVVGKGNEMAYKFAYKVSLEPSRFSPIFIYGGVGVGKTHLAQAIGNRVGATRPDLKIIYTSSEGFMNEMIKALKSGKMEDFRMKYRNVDVFIMDDVQFLMGKNGVQFELFNTFNALMDKKKQLVFCSDRAPSELKDFQDRLISRFKMGIVIEMRLPDVETRKIIARKIAEREGGGLDEELLDFLAENIDGSLRELRGAIIKLIAYQEIENKKVGIVEALDLVSGFLKKRASIDPSEKLISVLSGVFDTSPSMIRSKSRRANVLMARQIGMLFARKYLKMSLRNIGRAFNRSPSVVSQNIRKAEEKLKSNPVMKAYLNKILEHFSLAAGKETGR